MSLHRPAELSRPVSLSAESLSFPQSPIRSDRVPGSVMTQKPWASAKGGIFSGVAPEDVAVIIRRFWSKVNKNDTGCWLWTANRVKFGHGQFTFRDRDRKQHHVIAHRAAWELSYGRIPDGLCVLHRCDVPACQRPDHLFLGSQQDNLNDARTKGRLDESRPRTRTLTYQDRWTIYLAAPYSGICVDLARQYGVTKSCISIIRRGRFAGRVFERVPHVLVAVRGEVA